MINIKAEITFNREYKCLICENMSKVIYHVQDRNACYCGYCFGKLHHQDNVIIAKDCNDMSKSADKYTREYLEKSLVNISDTRLNINNARNWCLKDKDYKDINSAIDFLGGMIETFDSTIKKLESELEGK